MCGLAKYYVKPYFVVILISLILGILLSFKFGPIGMAIGFSVGNVLFQATAYMITYKRLGIKTRVF
jgi:O-antigen/teichoic acid export membrane protein